MTADILNCYKSNPMAFTFLMRIGIDTNSPTTTYICFEQSSFSNCKENLYSIFWSKLKYESCFQSNKKISGNYFHSTFKNLRMKSWWNIILELLL